MEFRFAATQLRLPLIVVVVGTGNTWENTEVQFYRLLTVILRHDVRLTR